MRLPILLSAALLTLPLIAKADTLTFDFVMSASPYSGSGSFTITTTPGQTVYTPDTGLGIITGSFDTLPITDSYDRDIPGMPESVTLVDGQITSLIAYPSISPGSSDEAPDGFIFGYLLLDGTTFIVGGEAPTPTPTDPGAYNHYFTEDGTLSFTEVTPEPSSFLLLTTGLTTVAGLLHRRLAHKNGSPAPCQKRNQTTATLDEQL